MNLASGVLAQDVGENVQITKETEMDQHSIPFDVPEISDNLFAPLDPPEISDNLVTTFHDLPPHTDIVTWANSAWPAWRMNTGVVVDLRLFDPHKDPIQENMIYRPEKLAECGVPDEVILAGAQSTPEGFVFIHY